MATRRITKDSDDDWANDPSAELFDLLDERLARAVRNRPNRRRPRNTGYMKEIRPHVWLLKVSAWFSRTAGPSPSVVTGAFDVILRIKQ